MNDAIFVYCPVCKRDYSNSQAEFHASLHNSAHVYDFRMPGNYSKDNSTSSTASYRAIQYPLVEPLEFGVN